MDKHLKDIERQAKRRIRELDRDHLREEVGRGYWVVKIVPWLVGVAVGLWTFSTCLPAPSWLDLAVYAFGSFAIFGAMAGQLTRVGLIGLFKRMRASR